MTASSWQPLQLPENAPPPPILKIEKEEEKSPLSQRPNDRLNVDNLEIFFLIPTYLWIKLSYGIAIVHKIAVNHLGFGGHSN